MKHVSKPIAQGDPGIDEMKQRKLDGEQIFEMDHYAAELSQLGVREPLHRLVISKR